MVRITDEDIITALEKNARTPASHIAQELGVTETAVRKRIQKLEEKGIIQHYTIRPHPKKSEYTIVFIGVDTKPEGYMRVAEEIAKKEAVKRGYTTSGDHHLQLECWFKTSDEYKQFLKELEDDENTTRICPGIVHEQIR